MLPSAAHLAPRRLTMGAGLRLQAPHYWLEIAAGPSVQDLDDAEPRLCYTTDTVAIAGRLAQLRIARRVPRLDCPERYLSLYLPAAAGSDAVYLHGAGDSFDDLAALRAVIATVRIDR
ncbi:MAG: hypothetical protein JSR60_10655 [Proteobacteria bacterium]|nr:hypothetical protein [Pseudomonadota bacterium]